MIRDATISTCGRYRYSLTRRWGTALPMVCFIGLNPSTADAETDDPTMRREINFARAWGFGSLVKVNLFALRETLPERMLCDPQPIGPLNDQFIAAAVQASSAVVCAWGTDGGHLDRDRDVLRALRRLTPPLCLRVTKNGFPAHTLYLPGGLTPIHYEGRKP